MDATGTAGYQALRETAAWLDLSDRGKLRASGEDRARLLHALATQNIQAMQPGDGCYTFFLNAQGRILGDANIFCREDSFLLDTEPETRAKLFEHIDRYIIADDVTIADVTSETATIALEGPAAQAALEKLGAPVPAEEFGIAEWGEQSVARVNSTGASGFFLFVTATEKAGLIADLRAQGIPQASDEEARIVRIEHGRPRYGEEISERYLVQETAQLHAVHFSKGCYLGQEIVERVRSRAQIHRVLRGLQIAASEPPPAGLKFKAGEVDAGEIVSAVYSPALQSVAAMAYMRTQFAEPGTQFHLGDALASVL